MRLIPTTRRRRDPGRSMSVIEHLEELRSRLIVALAAIAVGAVVGWVFYTWPFKLITHPYCHVLQQLPRSVRPPTHCRLVLSGVGEPFPIRFKIATSSGMAIAVPDVLFDLWR